MDDFLPVDQFSGFDLDCSGKRRGKDDIREDIFDYSTDENDCVESEPFSCDKCCYKTQKKWLMDRHVANHKKDKPFKCPNCRFLDRDASVFVDHFATHLPKTKIIKCCFCAFKSMPSMMKAHVLRHGPTERLDCSECEYWTLHLQSMTEHIEANHTKKHPCSMCSKVLTKYSLTKHMKKAHKLTKPLNIKTAVASRPGLSIISVAGSSMTRARKTSLAKSTMIPSVMPVVQLKRCRVPPGCWKSLEDSRKPQRLVNVKRSENWEMSDVASGSKGAPDTSDKTKSHGTLKVVLGSKTARKPLEAVTANWDALALGRPKPLHALGTRSARQKSLEMEHMDVGADIDDQCEEDKLVDVPKPNQIRKPNYFPNLISEYGETLMQCGICDFQTRRNHLLKRHEEKHADDLPFVCQTCGFQNISVYEFANHMVVAHGSVKDSVYSCCFCNFWTHKKHNIPIHLNHHRGAARLFDCPECEEVLNSKTGLQTHFEKLHCEYFDCEFCGKNMTSYELILHAKEHSDEAEQPNVLEPTEQTPIDPVPGSSTGSKNAKYKPKPLSEKKLYIDCSEVDDEAHKIDDTSKGTSSTAYKPKPLSKKIIDIQREGGKKQGEPLSFNCPSTSEKTKQFPAKIQHRPLSKMLTKPVKLSGPEEGPSGSGKNKSSPTTHAPFNTELECRLCDYKTEISSLMDRHKEKHKADTPFKCTKCKYETLSSIKMGWHFMYHFPSDKEFPCQYCNFNSKSRNSLHGHIERHRAVKFFDCSKCQFSGNSASIVQTHFKRMHVDTYSCIICDKVMTKHAMMKHLKKRHPTACIMPETGGPVQAQKHYMKFMKLIDGGTPQKELKRPDKAKTDTDDAVSSACGAQNSDHSQSDLKAAQAALAREIFGEMSESDNEAGKSPKTNSAGLPSTAVASSAAVPSHGTVPKLKIKSESEDSDSDAETVPKLSCPKCDFTANQVMGVKTHYREMHEIEYACKLCPEIKPMTKYELLAHFKNGHPKVSFQYYNSMTKCCAQEKEIPPTTRPVVCSSDDSDSDDETVPSPNSSKQVNNDPATVSRMNTEPVPPSLVSSADESKMEAELNLDTEQSRTDMELCLSPLASTSAVPGSTEEVDPSPAYSPIRKGSGKMIESVDSDGISDSAVREDFAMDVEQLEEQAAEIVGEYTELVKAAEAVVEAVEVIETAESPSRLPQKLKCGECDFHTNRMSLMQRHSVKHKSGAPLVCPQCQFQNNSPYEFLLHWKNHFPDRTAFKCCFCAFATISKLDLALHFCVHNNTRVFDCHECDYSTSTKAFFEGHVWSIHKKVTCQKCQESMDRAELLNHKCLVVEDDDVLNTSPRVGVVSAGMNGETESPQLSVQAGSSFRKLGCRKVPMTAESADCDQKDKDKRIVLMGESATELPTAELTLAFRVPDPAEKWQASAMVMDGAHDTYEPSIAEEAVGEHASVDPEESGSVRASVRQKVSLVDEENNYESRIVDEETIIVGDSDMVECCPDDSMSEGKRRFQDAANTSTSVQETEQLLTEGIVHTGSDRRQPIRSNTDIPLPQQLSFTNDSVAGEPSDNVPVIDISGTNKPALPPKPPSGLSWTEPIESDDDSDGEAIDHNYVVSHRRSSKSSSADRSRRSAQPRSSPIKSDDFPSDYVTEVVFDNGMSAIVLEVSDESEGDL